MMPLFWATFVLFCSATAFNWVAGNPRAGAIGLLCIACLILFRHVIIKEKR